MIINIEDHNDNNDDNNVIYAPITDKVHQNDELSVEDELAQIEVPNNQNNTVENNDEYEDVVTIQAEPPIHRDPFTMQQAVPVVEPQNTIVSDNYNNTDDYQDATPEILEAVPVPMTEVVQDVDAAIEERRADEQVGVDIQSVIDDTTIDVETDVQSEEEQKVPLADYKMLEQRLEQLMSDWDNYRKRTANDIKVAQENANINLVETLLPTLDNFRLAVSHIDAQNMDETTKGIISGFVAINRSLMASLGKEGLTVIEPAIGDKFDMNIHQAVQKVSNPELEPDSVAAVIQVGYMFKNKVIRPAMICVSA